MYKWWSYKSVVFIIVYVRIYWHKRIDPMFIAHEPVMVFFQKQSRVISARPAF